MADQDKQNTKEHPLDQTEGAVGGAGDQESIAPVTKPLQNLHGDQEAVTPSDEVMKPQLASSVLNAEAPVFIPGQQFVPQGLAPKDSAENGDKEDSTFGQDESGEFTPTPTASGEDVVDDTADKKDSTFGKDESGEFTPTPTASGEDVVDDTANNKDSTFGKDESGEFTPTPTASGEDVVDDTADKKDSTFGKDENGEFTPTPTASCEDVVDDTANNEDSTFGKDENGECTPTPTASGEEEVDNAADKEDSTFGQDENGECTPTPTASGEDAVDNAADKEDSTIGKDENGECTPTPTASGEDEVDDTADKEDSTFGQDESGEYTPTPTASGEDILDDTADMDILGNGLLMKKVLQKGAGTDTRPKHNEVAGVKYCGKLLDSTIIDTFDGDIIVGDGEVITALDLALALMETGEVCELRTDAKYAYGENGRPGSIPGNSSLAYKIELVSVSPPHDWASMPQEKRFAIVQHKRSIGNSFYSIGLWSQAVANYYAAIQILQAMKASLMTRDAKVACYNNMGISQLKLGAHDAAIASFDEVLKIEPDNTKALYRKGKSLAEKGELELAVTALKKAIELEPESKAVQQLLADVTKKLRESEEQEKTVYRRMFAGAESKKEQTEEKKSAGFIQSVPSWVWLAGGTALVASAAVAAYKYFH